MGNSVNDFSVDSLTKRVYSKYSTNPVDTNVSKDKMSGYLDFNGYLELLVAQMSNQDFNDPMSDSEFIQQMASYSMMEAIGQLTNQTAISYSSSLIGKAVTVNDSTGVDTGIVEAVTISDGVCKLLVNGNQYSTDAITDVVDGDIYTKLSSFVGQTVEIADGDSTITGKVTGLYISNGDGYVVIDNKNAYSLSAIRKIVSDETEDETSDEAADESENTNTSEVDTSAASYYSPRSGEDEEGITSRSQAAYDTLMSMLDSTNGESDASDSESIRGLYNTATVSSFMESKAAELKTATVSGNVAASGIYSDDDSSFGGSDSISRRIPKPYFTPETTYTTSETAYTASETQTARTYSDGEEFGVTTVSESNATYKLRPNIKFDNYIAETDEYPVSTRRFADRYPVEAAYADAVGTEMTDIRFITNNSITSRIDTSEILGYTESGRAFTDIGFSGKGRLGEVVTWADGTQRVEVIDAHGSTWFTTSGNLTLDEICDFTGEPGCLVGKLTPFEQAIRYFSREYSDAEMKEMAQFEEYVRYLAQSYTATQA